MIQLSVVLLLAPALPFQQGQAPAAGKGTESSATPDAAGSAQVEALRARIHDMRMNLLLGGEKVRSAETDATRFYKEKTELVEQRMDSLSAELTELRASYQLSLEHALKATTEEQRKATLQEAGELHHKIDGLESERSDLTARRARLEKLVEAVEARGRERQKLATKIDAEQSFDEPLGPSLGGIGLAPELEVMTHASALDDPGLVQDLLSRDPVAARQILFEADPRGYWQLFPLQPPAAALRQTLKFPAPDLPGQR